MARRPRSLRSVASSTWRADASVSGQALRSFLLAHTLERPRDIIALVNKVLATNEGAPLPLTSRAVTTAEPSYSRDRLGALQDEWRSCHPLVGTYLKVLTGLSGPVEVQQLDEERLFELLFEVDALEREPLDEIERIAKSVFQRDKELRLRKLARTLVCCLFKMGAVGVKVHSNQGYTFCFQQHATLQDSEIGDTTKFIVHPMISSALGSRPEQSQAA